MLKLLRVLLLGIGLALPVVSSQADQYDTRLDSLFSQLQSTTDLELAAKLTAEIWRIWTLSEASVSVLMNQAGHEVAARRYTRALELLDQIVVLAPEFAEAWNRRATVYYLLGRYRESVADIQSTLVLEPRHFGALAGLGLLYIEIQDYPAALAAFNQAIEINPHLPSVRQHILALQQRLAQTGI